MRTGPAQPAIGQSHESPLLAVAVRAGTASGLAVRIRIIGTVASTAGLPHTVRARGHGGKLSVEPTVSS